MKSLAEVVVSLMEQLTTNRASGIDWQACHDITENAWIDVSMATPAERQALAEAAARRLAYLQREPDESEAMPRALITPAQQKFLQSMADGSAWREVDAAESEDANTARDASKPPSPERILDFGPIGMWWEITKSTADTLGESFEAVNVIEPGFAGPPLHVHPYAEESYAVVSGTLDVCLGKHWRKLSAGESATVPVGMPHTLRNTSTERVRLVNVHRPALGFERFFRRLHALATTGQVKFPPKDFGSLVLVSMLFVANPREIRSAKPPHVLMRVLAWIGWLCGYRLPP